MKEEIMNRKKFSVWVDGGEVNSSLLTKKQAEILLMEWQKDGYDDAEIVEYTDEEMKSLEGIVELTGIPKIENNN